MFFTESIRRIVREIDPRFDVRWEPDSTEYVITQTNPQGETSWFDSISFEDIARNGDKAQAFFEHMRRVVYTNRNGDIVAETENKVRNMAAKRDEKRREAVHNLVKDEGERLYRAIREA